MQVLGIDVATVKTGIASINTDNSEWDIWFDTIKAKGKDINYRLLDLYTRIEKILLNSLEKYDMIVVEDQFLGENVSSLKALSQARGVVMVLAAKYNIPLEVITPTEAKKALTGNGRATKEQVRKAAAKKFVAEFQEIKEDEADALALAYTVIKRVDK